MKAKKLLCAMLCLVMVFALAVPAFAAKATTSTFTDTKGSWAEHEIALVADAGIVGGYPDGTFRPNANITREAFAKVVANFMGFTEEADLSQYTDVNPGGALTPYVARCVAAGVMGGFSDTRMAPKNNITREQAAAMLRRAFQLKTAGQKANFTDAASIAEKLQPEVAALEATGLITGYADGTFRPKANLTRAQMMVIISRLLPDNDGYFMTMSASAGDIPMNCEMLNDYSTLIFLPTGTADASSVSFKAKLYEVPGIGIDISSMLGQEISDTIETGVDEKFEPQALFPAAYDFNFATAKISVNGAACTFNMYGKQAEGGINLTLTPVKTADAEKMTRTAMNSGFIDLVSIFLKGNSATLANGSYIQVGTEKIGFAQGNKKDLKIDLTADEATITETVMNALELYKDVKNDGNQATIFIAKGSSIATEEGTFKLAKNVTITLNGASESFDGILSKLVEMDTTNIEMLTGLANEIISAIEGNVVNVVITIK
ncbi:MAG: S-layer homology domain-containing protein [Bacillota bacterium]|nr:S-layer homology domain-containing protein [Bacillota bacterium]